MTKPITVDLPHSLGAAEAKRRMQNGIGKLKDYIPGGGQVESSWEGDRMHLRVNAMGQQVTGHMDVLDQVVRMELMLPPVLGLFAGKIAGMLKSGGAEMLEDKSKG